jgi:outer membrane immunogenic protein
VRREPPTDGFITMKKILLSTVALLGLSATAMAADLPRRTLAPAPAPFVAVPVFTWTGFYVGVNAGYGFNANSGDDYTFVPGVGLVYTGDNGSDGGFVGGAQVGYNMQFGSFVAGVEADIQYADIGGGNNNGFFNGFNNNGNNGVDWFGTVRARLGVAFDRVLVYATGGLAYGEGGDDNAFVFNGVVYRNNDDIRVGWTLGAGVEYAITNNLTVKLEGLYVNLGDNNDNNVFFNNAAFGRNRETEFGVVRAGLNFKF